MPSSRLTLEGIVLRSIPFQERHRILSLFTKQAGLVSLIIKNVSPKNLQRLALATPLTRAEFVCQPRLSSLYPVLDGTVLDEHFPLRERFSSLQTAGTMAHSLLCSQMAEKPSRDLYNLFQAYLRTLSSFSTPQILLTSFLLKLLKHDGLLLLHSQCTECKETTANSYYSGESFCSLHSPPLAVSFSQEEWRTLLQLVDTTHFSELRTLSPTPEIHSWAEECFRAEFPHFRKY